MLPLFVPGSAEFLNMRKSQIDEHPEVAAFFERMTMLPLEKITPMVPPGGAGIGMHVIPVEKAIETENKSVDLEHISYWLSKYEGKYAKSMCSCRLSRAKLGEGCGDDAESWCIGVGDMADYIVETQRGEYITKDEALEIFKKAEDNGFVHQITNIDGKKIDTPPKELELLYHLAATPNRVYTRNQLLDEVWGFDYFGDSRTVDVHVKRLREKVENVSDQWALKTVWGVGYKFEVK